MPKISKAKLTQSFESDLTAVWNDFKIRFPQHNPYAFVLYGVEGGCPRLNPEFLTDVGLADVSRKYVEGGYNDDEKEAANDLRYSVADSPLFGAFADKMPLVSHALKAWEDEFIDDEEGYKILVKSAVDALATMNENGIFGKDEERSKIVVLIIVEGIETYYTEKTSKKFNPPDVLNKFKEQTKITGEFKSSSIVRVSKDGSSLFIDCHKRPEKKESINEVVSIKNKNGKFLRNWTYQFPTFGDSIADLKISKDEQHIFTVRRQYCHPETTCLIQKFSALDGEVISEHSISGNFRSMELLENDKIIICIDRSLNIFDSSLKLVESNSLNEDIYKIKFNDKNEIFLSTSSGIKIIKNGDLNSINWKDIAALKPAIKPSFKALDMDCQGKLIVIGQAMCNDEEDAEVSFDEDDDGTDLFEDEEDEEDAFGLFAYDQEMLKTPRELFLPGYQLSDPIISPNAEFLCCHAHRIKGYRLSLMIFSLITGDKLDEKKIEDIDEEMIFTPDSKSVILAIGDFMKGEPLAIWKFKNKLQ